jgi:hypothetical protein
MKGSAGIPVLQLETLNKLISNIDKTPSNFFSNMFASVQYPSDAITWEIEYASGGMTPFVAPGSVAPTVGIDGVSKGSAKAAYWKEKMYFDEEFLNNLRQPGTTATYQTAERQLAKGVQKLRYRCERRREWMMAQMMVNGSLNYTMPAGAKISISYGVPSTHAFAPTSTAKWNTPKATTTADIVGDIFTARTVLSTDAGVTPNNAIINSQMLQVMIIDKGIQTLLAKSAFGNGDLFSNPNRVLASLLGLSNITVYDDLYEIQAYLNGAVTGGATVAIPVDDAIDFEVGGVLRIFNLTKYNTYEDRVITAVDQIASTVTVASAYTNSYVAGRDKVIMRKKFILDNQFLMFSDTADGQKIAEFMEAPYGLDRHWGFKADTETEWDPEGIWLRVQDKGLPVMYRPDTSFLITAW